MERFKPPTPEERHARRAELGIPGDCVACLFVGRLSREKGLLDLVAAWQTLRPQGATLLIAGPDMPGSAWNAGPAARDSIAGAGLNESVRFLGPSNDVRSLLHAADVLVQPSHFEALGLSAVEALACGVPVVASAVGGLLDFVIDGVNGRLVPVQDPAALGSALRAVIDDPGLRTRLRRAARASVAEYDQRTVFSRMGALLERLADNRA